MTTTVCTCTEAAHRRGWSTECEVPEHRLRELLGTEQHETCLCPDVRGGRFHADCPVHMARLAGATERGAAKAEVRDGDQARPLTADPAAPGAHDELLAMLAERRAYGLARYGTTLQPHTGRNTGRDLVDELVDGAVYAITLRHELEELEELLRQVVGGDYGELCDHPDDCVCSAGRAIRVLRRRGVL